MWASSSNWQRSLTCFSTTATSATVVHDQIISNSVNAIHCIKNISSQCKISDFFTEFLYHLTRINRLNFWAGGTLQGFMDMRNIPLLQNAATSYSLFGNFCATGMMQYDFAFNREKTHTWLSAYGKLSLPLACVVSRPGYAYIGNPTINYNALFSENETFAKFFPGASTELGLYLNLLNANRIGLSYRWDYLTTGKKGAHRYDNALHSLNLSFMFRIN